MLKFRLEPGPDQGVWDEKWTYGWDETLLRCRRFTAV